MDDFESYLRNRNRILALQADGAAVRDAASGRMQPEPVLIGQVFNGGSKSALTGRYVLVHPGRATSIPSEGPATGYQWDLARSIPVAVLGDQVPAVGDVLHCSAVASRWVAEKTGPPPPCTTGSICVTINSSCDFPLTGLTVTVTDDASPPNVIDTPITVGAVASVTAGSSGSGYTNATGYALGISGNGTGATGTFDVVGGHVANIVITNGGVNYSTATITFPGAGGSGATGTAVIKGRACISLPSAGTYHVTAHVPGATDQTATINAVCGIVNNVTLTFPPAAVGRICASYTYCTRYLSASLNTPYAGVSLTVTGPGGATATGVSGGDGTVCFVVGLGDWTGTATFPRGAVLAGIGWATVTACSTKTVAPFLAVTQQTFAAFCFEVISCDCTVTVRNNVGVTCGTGVIPLRPSAPPFSGAAGNVDIDLSPELINTSLDNRIDTIWPASMASATDVAWAPVCGTSTSIGAYHAPLPCSNPP